MGRAAKWKERLDRFIRASRRTLKVPIDYYLRLSSTERILILVILIVLFTPRLKDPIIQIINAIKGLPGGR